MVASLGRSAQLTILCCRETERSWWWKQQQRTTGNDQALANINNLHLLRDKPAEGKSVCQGPGAEGKACVRPRGK